MLTADYGWRCLLCSFFSSFLPWSRENNLKPEFCIVIKLLLFALAFQVWICSSRFSWLLYCGLGERWCTVVCSIHQVVLNVLSTCRTHQNLIHILKLPLSLIVVLSFKYFFLHQYDFYLILNWKYFQNLSWMVLS